MISDVKHIADALVTEWSGGSIRQLAIFPQEAVYAEKDFLWYVSSATVEQEISRFTVMQNYNRWILTLNASITLCRPKEPDVLLPVLRPYFFDGAVQIQSIGRAQDFNLILQKHSAEGDLQSAVLQPWQTREIFAEQHHPFSKFTALVFCAFGYCRLHVAGAKEVDLKQGQYCMFDSDITASGLHSQASLVICKIYYEKRKSFCF